MPTYDYECDACGHTWELFQSITAEPVSKCPECGKKKARRLFGTGAALMFKGSGFYETDYRSESYKKSAEAEKSSTESNSTGSSDKSDTKTAKPDSTESKPEPKSATNSSAQPSQETTKRSRKKDK
jgi:putative FmdB family regulatory protein